MSTRLIKLLAIYGLGVTTLVTLVNEISGSAVSRAIIDMALGLFFLWIVIGGALMRSQRERLCRRVSAVHLGCRVKFVLFATLLVLIEEAITTLMTNLAPLFGVKVGQAYITASANYLDVIFFHSVIVIIPMFIAWAWLLARYKFSPNAVFLLFGLTGTLAEMSLNPSSLINIGFWTFVYGLMIYLPAYCCTDAPSAKAPRWFHYPLAVFLPFVFALPVAFVVGVLHPIAIHFPPIQSS